MEIQYVGHSCFRLKGKEGIVITDPFHSSVGFAMPSLKADVVTVSHQHDDHNYVTAVKATANRSQPFIITHPGEYEVGGISVYGYHTWHDGAQGAQRGANVIYSIFMEDLHILHLGDLGHKLDDNTLEEIAKVDVVLCPVGGIYTIDPKQAAEVIASLEPAFIIPMHYRTPEHQADTFASLATLAEFLQEYGKEPQHEEKFVITRGKIEEDADTKLVVLTPKVSD